MADFTLTNPGTTNNPYNPANIIIPTGGLQSDATGFWPASVATSMAHNTGYGATITTTATLGAVLVADILYIGAVVRTGANAGALIGIYFSGSTEARTRTIDAAFTPTNISTGSAIAALQVGDVLSCTVAISGGTATITGSVNATPITFSANTTTTFAGEASLAAGLVYDPQNSNLTKVSQFTGTGVAGSATSLLKKMRRYY